MPNYSSRRNIPKASPTEKGDVSLTHNLWNTLGKVLYEGINTGRLDPRKLENLSANLGVALGGDYGLDVGYNQYMGDLRQDLKLTVSKKF
jgi:hypothetical protein|tara:strand:+ start:499 stop:768 length:270 start_codon:yes stop_codon:yes gene_type:complete